MGIVKQPLLHFLAGALLIFAFDAVRSSGGGHPSYVALTEADVSRLSAEWERQWLRPPTESELDGMIDSWVEDEILFRQAQMLGLGNDDPVVRRYLGNKMKFLMQDSVMVPEPTDADLQSYYDTHRDAFAPDSRFAFEDVRLDGLDEAGAKALLADLKQDAPLQGVTLDAASGGRLEISRRYGLTFYETLATLTPGTWEGPVASALGLHFIRVQSVERGEAPTFDRVRDEVAEAWRLAKREELERAAFDQIAAEYKVRRPEPAAP